MASKILIRNGLLFTGDKDQKAEICNILIEGNKIKQISKNDIPHDADTEIIDASGCWITPGFIDAHTHYDAELVASPGLKESARHGVTTVVVGSCSV